MLSNALSATPAQRLAVAGFALVFLGLAFVPVRLVQAHSTSTTRVSSETRFSGTIERAGKRTPIAFLIKTESEKGTRGSVDEFDLDHARQLEHMDGTVVYFRLGERAWTTSDPATLDAVRRALEPEDALEARESVYEQRRVQLEQERSRLEGRAEEVDGQRAALEDERAKLGDRIDKAADEGRDTRELRADARELDAKIELCTKLQEELSSGLASLSQRFSIADQATTTRYAERDRVHQRVLEEIARIAREAVARGRAETFGPSGNF